MWNRKVTVTISSDDGYVNLLFGYDPQSNITHRIDFEYNSVMGWAGDYGTITLFNLSSDEIKTLQRKEHGSLTVQLSVGYEDESGIDDYLYGVNSHVPNVIFVGSITNAINYKNIPENITHLYCVPQQINQVTQLPLNVSYEVQEGKTFKDALLTLTGFAGLGYRTSGVPDEILNYKFTKSRTFHGTLVEEIAKLCLEFNLSYSIQPSFVEVYPSTVGSVDIVNDIAKQRPPIVVTADKVVGTPVAGIGTLELSMIINASITTGMLVDVTSLITPDGSNPVNGYIPYNAGYLSNIDETAILNGMSNIYQIVSLTHHGSTHSDTFQTDIHGVYGVGSTMSGIEDRWREWCTKAYGIS